MLTASGRQRRGGGAVTGKSNLHRPAIGLLRIILPPFLLPRLTLRLLVAVPLALVVLALPAVSRSFLFHVLTCLYARLLCCCFGFYLPSLRGLPLSCPFCPLRTFASSPCVAPLPSSLRLTLDGQSMSRQKGWLRNTLRTGKGLNTYV